MQQLVNDPKATVDPTIRLRIATRIHFALLRHYDEDVAVSNLLAIDAAGQEGLWVCEASKNEELLGLAKQFARENTREGKVARVRSSAPVGVAAALAVARAAGGQLPAPRPARVSTAPALAWAPDSKNSDSRFSESRFSDSRFTDSRLPKSTSFGESVLPSFMQTAPKSDGWLKPGAWLRRATASLTS